MAYGCSMHFRNKGNISVFSVHPLYRPSNLGFFKPDDFDRKKLGKDIKKFSPDSCWGVSLKKEFEDHSQDKDFIQIIVRDFNELLCRNDLYKDIKDENYLPDHVRDIYRKAKDRKSLTLSENIKLNRAILQKYFPNGTEPCREPVFAGGFLRGAYAILTDDDYITKNSIKKDRAYRFSFDKIHVRYLDEVGGAEFLVYVELFRGADLKPFYVQVIGYETDIPRNSDLVLKTVMTPSFLYGTDEPVLMRIVGVDLDTKEEEEAAMFLKNLDDVALGLASMIPQATLAPMMTKAAQTLFALAKDGDDIEFQYSICFYPPDSPMIKVKHPEISGSWKDYTVVLPMVAAQYVLIKDENVMRRVPLETYWEYIPIPITRGIPCLSWFVAALIGEPYHVFTNTHFRDTWRFPGLWDEPVDKKSYAPVDNYAKNLAVYNDELRLAEEDKGCFLEFVEDRPKEEYKNKTYVIFSLLQTETPTSEDLIAKKITEHTKALMDLGLSDTYTSPQLYIQLINDMIGRYVQYTNARGVFEKIDQLDEKDPQKIKILFQAMKDSTNDAFQMNLIKQRLNSMMISFTKSNDEIFALLNSWTDPQNPLVEWNLKERKFDLKKKKIEVD